MNLAPIDEWIQSNPTLGALLPGIVASALVALGIKVVSVGVRRLLVPEHISRARHVIEPVLFAVLCLVGAAVGMLVGWRVPVGLGVIGLGAGLVAWSSVRIENGQPGSGASVAVVGVGLSLGGFGLFANSNFAVGLGLIGFGIAGVLGAAVLVSRHDWAGGLTSAVWGLGFLVGGLGFASRDVTLYGAGWTIVGLGFYPCVARLFQDAIWSKSPLRHTSPVLVGGGTALVPAGLALAGLQVLQTTLTQMTVLSFTSSTAGAAVLMAASRLALVQGSSPEIDLRATEVGQLAEVAAGDSG